MQFFFCKAQKPSMSFIFLNSKNFHGYGLYVIYTETWMWISGFFVFDATTKSYVCITLHTQRGEKNRVVIEYIYKYNTFFFFGAYSFEKSKCMMIMWGGVYEDSAPAYPIVPISR